MVVSYECLKSFGCLQKYVDQHFKKTNTHMKRSSAWQTYVHVGNDNERENKPPLQRAPRMEVVRRSSDAAVWITVAAESQEYREGGAQDAWIAVVGES